MGLGAGTAYAQARDATPAQSDPILPGLLHARAALLRDTVDVSLDEAANHPFVWVTVDGHGPFRFGIETGAPTLVVASRVAQVIGHATEGTTQFEDRLRFIVDSLALGAARFYEVPAVATSGDLGGLDGVLGLNVYYDLLTTVDYHNHRVRFTRDTLSPANGHDVLTLQPIDGQIYGMEIRVDGKPSLAALDTQNEVPFIVTPSQVTDSQFVVAPVPIGTASGVGIGLQPCKEGRWKGEISVGGVSFRQPVVTVVPMPWSSLQRWNVGWPTLRRFTMTLDQRTRHVRLAATADNILQHDDSHR